MIKKILLLIGVMSLTACVSTQSVMNRVGNEYIGHNMDKFVVDHGTPQSRYVMNNGNIAYRWSSETQTINTASHTTGGGSVGPYGTVNTYSTTTGGGSIKLVCILQIVTDKEGTIISFKPIKDTLGFWTTSACHEHLGYLGKGKQ